MPHPRTVAPALVLVLLAALLSLATAATPSRAQTADVRGATPVEVAVNLSAQRASADTVVVARADDYADGLTAGPLAASLSAPLLLTPQDALPQVVGDEITRLGAERIIIIGGPAAVSPQVEEQLGQLGASVERLAGEDRFMTAVNVAGALIGEQQPERVYFVEGENLDPARGWPDAIAVSALAGFDGLPILPVNAEFVPDTILNAWLGWSDAQGIIVGGPEAVSEAVEAELAAAVPAAEADPALAQDAPSRDLLRLAGESRDGTAAELFTFGVSELGMDPTSVTLIPAGSFGEGLAAGAEAATTGTPLLYLGADGLSSTQATADLLAQQSGLIDDVRVVAADDAVTTTAVEEARAALDPTAAPAAFCLTLLHHNDGESQLIQAPGLPDFGGLARMVTLAGQQQAAPVTDGCEDSGVITVTSGDNFLAGPEFNASLDRPEGQPFYDAVGLAQMGYDALDLGNHDFDFGPDVLERFIESFPADSRPPFLSANLDFSGEPGLQALVEAGDIAPSTVVTKGDVQVGIIGLTTPDLDIISTPRDVVIDDDVVGAVTTQVQALEAAGVQHIVLISHLQGLDSDIELISQVSGVDAVVAGGGDEVLASTGDPLVPGDLANTFGGYPLLFPDADGQQVPTVTTAGDYKYLGRLDLRFDAEGELLADAPVDQGTSRMLRVAGEGRFDGVAADADVQRDAIAPVEAYVDGLAANVIATSEVDLDGSRPNIRQTETNIGNLMADASIQTVLASAADFGLTVDADRLVGLQNGGGIRNNNVIPAGDVSVLTTFDIAPFSNFVVAMPDVTPAQLKAVLERGYAAVENAAGQFAHIGGMTVEVDVTRTAQEIDGETSQITTPGERVRTITLADGTPIVVDGAVVSGAPSVTVATIDFLANGGDGYPLGDLAFTRLGRTYQQALQDLIEGPLAGEITAAAYPEGGSGRITITGLEG